MAAGNGSPKWRSPAAATGEGLGQLIVGALERPAVVAPLRVDFLLQRAQARIALIDHVFALAQHRLEDLSLRLGALQILTMPDDPTLQIRQIFLVLCQLDASRQMRSRSESDWPLA